LTFLTGASAKLKRGHVIAGQLC